MNQSFDAYVAFTAFTQDGQAVFALGDGTVRFESGAVVQAHDGAVLSACLHPSGKGLITGGDDGKVQAVTPDGAQTLAALKGKWIDSVDASAASGLVAFACGREAQVRDLADPGFERRFPHERTVAAVVLDPKGRRLACATYGGATLWFARIADQKPQMLKWAGSHIGVTFSPDGRFLLSSMQENALHGWRLADGKEMRMGGYPSKVRSVVFFAKGALMATAGANGAVVWPFAGANGPMGKDATEIGYEHTESLVLRVAAAPNHGRLIAGLDDGRVWLADLAGRGLTFLKAEKGPPITALALSADGRRAAWGDEEGGAAVVDAGEIAA